MNSTIWKQTDTRWAKKAYPSGSTVGGCGCGLLACVHVAMEQERYKNWTPDNLRSWMVSKGFAIRGQGTKWEGITETLKHIGHTKVVRIYNDPMSEAWKELNKGNRIGVILFNSNRGHRFTSSGHYIAFTDYKVKDGKHYFYLKDSGGRNNSGWKCYETYCKGCISKVWIVERVGKQTIGSAVTTPSVSATTYRPTTPYKGSLPTSVVKKGSRGASAKAVQTFLNWCINAKLTTDSIAGANTSKAIMVYQKTYGLTVDGVFGSASKAKAQSIINAHKGKTSTPSTPSKPAVKTNGQEIADLATSYAYAGEPKESKYPSGHAKDAYKKGLNKAFPDRDSWSNAPRKGASCDVFVGTCVRNSGVDKKFPRGLAEQEKSLKKSGKFTDIKYNGDRSKLKAGDIVVMQYNNGRSGHICIVKNSKHHICEANLKSTYGITVKTKGGIDWRLKHRTGKDYCHVYRAK